MNPEKSLKKEESSIYTKAEIIDALIFSMNRPDLNAENRIISQLHNNITLDRLPEINIDDLSEQQQEALEQVLKLKKEAEK